jgi:hypothetical protein
MSSTYEQREWIRLDFQGEKQKETNWCWAAVSASVSKFFNSSTRWTQCKIVNAELEMDDCCESGGSDNCNRSWYLDLALTRTGNLRTWERGAKDLDEVIKEVKADKPLCARIGWEGGGGHALTIYGGNKDLDMVAVDDPWYGSSDVTLTALEKGQYQGSGTWTDTYRTKK